MRRVLWGVALALALSACSLPEGLTYEGEGGKVVLRTTPWPPAARAFSQFEVTIERADTPPQALTLVLAMPEMEHPDIIVALKRSEDGQSRYRGAGRIIHGGLWEMTVKSPEGVRLAYFEVEVAP